MRIKIVGVKVGQSRPTSDKTIAIEEDPTGLIQTEDLARLGDAVACAMSGSNFVILRRVVD